jgi:magnesium transporter
MGKKVMKYKSIKSRKVGLPPGTIEFLHSRNTIKSNIRLISFNELDFSIKEDQNIKNLFPLKPVSHIHWIDIDGHPSSETLEQLGDKLSLHPLVLEDIATHDERPTIVDKDNILFIILSAITINDRSNEIEKEQISIILGANFVVSIQEKGEGIFNPIKERIEHSKGRVRKMGADYLTYTLIDIVADHYFNVLEVIGEKIEYLEEDLIANPTSNTLKIIHELKRELIFLRKNIWPMREVINKLDSSGSELISGSLRVYLSDVYDHIIQIIDYIETYREMISGMLDIYLSSTNNRMNEVMKILTIISTFFIPLTFIVGLYGMNFKYMPELQWIYGYPLVWIIMIIISFVMFIYFRRKKWF